VRAACDFSGTAEAVIKGNISGDGERIYHTPESPFYSRTEIDVTAGEQWFCTVAEAEAAGWRAPLASGSEAPATPTQPPAPTGTPVATATAIPTPEPTPTGVALSAGVRIACVFYDGVVPTKKSDEYVEIVNDGAATVNLAGWKLVDTADGTPTFTFPTLLLVPGQAVRVYTDEVRPEWGGLTFGRGSSIWNNTEPDTAGLFDAQGTLVSSATYPPGC
jgi:hypothetical protein